ncbi:hypothetical protein QZH41_007093 [Actinostola sp. cb2023]|nr:hypothetical protein QZH41_007093 [Actinostola sp. cb2023]
MPITTSLSSKIRKSSRKLYCQVVLLDNTTFSTTFEQKSAKGKDLSDRVCDHLGLSDREYFGLQYIAWEDGELNWLDSTAEIRTQRSKPYHFQLAVKFYPRFPRKIGQKARVLMCLQIKDLLLRGKYLTLVPVKQHAMLDGLFAQVWLGDFNTKIHHRGYIQQKLDRFFVAPCGINSDEDIIESKYEGMVHQHHRQHKGMNAEDAAVTYIERAQDLLKFYGISIHKGATDKEGTRVLLGVYERGILVYEINDSNEPGALVLEISWQEVIATHSKNRKFHVLFFNDVKKDGGAFGYRFHGHGGQQAAMRMHEACVAHKEFFYRPEKKLNRQSRSFAEADSIVRNSGDYESAATKYATTGRDIKRAKSSFGRLKTSIRKKLPRKRKVQDPERIVDSVDAAKRSTIT